MKLPIRIVVIVLACVAVVGTTGCKIRKGMYDQPKYKPYQKSEFFPDQRASRVPPEGTVARGMLHEDVHMYQGLVDGKLAESFPFPVTLEVVKRGQERFNIYCAPCHDQAGTGRGLVVQRGFKQPNSYHIDRLRTSPPGYFYDVITKGFGQMNSYAAQVKPEDRWAIVAYIRALQLSQHAKIEDVPEGERANLQTASASSHGTSGH